MIPISTRSKRLLTILSFLLVSLTLSTTGCPSTASYGNAEPCWISYNDDTMSEPAYCAIEVVSREPCAELAECLCDGWIPAATPGDLNMCVAQELAVANDEPTVATVCGTEANLSMASAIESYALMRNAQLSLDGSCETLPTVR